MTTKRKHIYKPRLKTGTHLQQIINELSTSLKLNEREIELFNYVLDHWLIKGWNPVKIEEKTYKKYFRSVAVDSIIFHTGKGLILKNDYNGTGRICKKANDFQIHPRLIIDIFSAYLEDIKEGVNQGKPKDHIRTKSNKPLPQLILQSLEQLEHCQFNLEELELIKDELLDGKLNINHQSMVSAFLVNVSRQYTNQVNRYQLAYECGSTGRIFERGKGFQNLPVEYKQRLLLTQENVKNYDLKSSQIAVLVTMMEAANLECSFLQSYLADDSIRDQMAKAIGIEKGDFKKLLFGLIFKGVAGKLSYCSYIKDKPQPKLSKLLERIVKKKPTNSTSYNLKEECKKLVASVNHVMEPISAEIKVWNDHLKETYGKRKRVNNACGLTLNGLEDLKEDVKRDGKVLYTRIGSKWVSKLSAFLIQGVESCFIHHLTILSEDYDYQVISNEHDGLTVIGEIPLEAIEEAKRLSGFEKAELVEKPFQ